MASPDNCPFCEIIKNDPPPHCIYEDSRFIVILDRESMGLGHCLIIPRRHVSKIYELDNNVYNELFKVAKRLSNILKKLDNVRSVAYVASGSGVQHVHLHLVPHNDPDVLMNPLNYIKKLDGNELAEKGKFIRDFIKQN